MRPAAASRGRGGRRGWSVFDGVRALSPTPEALMADVDAAIAASEYAYASALLSSASLEDDEPPSAATAVYDARLADEAYKAACASLAAGQADAAIRSLRVALASCPPEKTSALGKLRSLLAIASSLHHKQQLQHQIQR